MIVALSKECERRGAVLVWNLLSLTVIVGVVAIGMDGGRMFEKRRDLQASADAAALAAAVQLYENHQDEHGQDESGKAREAALECAVANGCNNDGVDCKVIVNIPPASGEFAGRAEFAEVIIEAKLPRSFSTIFTGEKLKTIARAVARGRPSPIGFMALKPSGAGTFRNRSLSIVTAVGSPIIVNSDDPAAFTNGNLGIIAADEFRITGDYTNNGIMLGPKRTGVPPAPDPLRYLPAPNLAGLPVQSAKQLQLNGLLPRVLQPGIYRGGITIGNLAIVIMRPGIYVMEGGGFQVSGLATVTGLEVMIYNTSGAIAAGNVNIQGLGKVVLTAPTSGVYRGVGIFQDRACTSPLTLKGTALAALTGTVYAPAADVAIECLAAIGVGTLGGAHIASTIDISGLGSINIDLGRNRPRVPDIRLVE